MVDNKRAMTSEVKDSNPYSRLMALQRLGVVDDYTRIRNFTVCIIGVGGVGSVVAEMLTRCGIGKLILYDYDSVELANMNRMFYMPSHQGMAKVEAAKVSLTQINPDVEIEVHNANICGLAEFDKFKQRVLEGSPSSGRCDLVLSCVDNYAARMSINKACNEMDQVWIESGVSENAMSGHIQLLVPGETACFACAPPLVIATQDDERNIQRPGVCAASLPTTMAIVAGFLSQNVLKYLLGFGEVCPFLGYNALTDFFPRYDLSPNTDCTDSDCCRLQEHYKENPAMMRTPKLKPEKKAPEPVVPSENEWGIEVMVEEESVVPESKNQIIPKDSHPVPSSSQPGQQEGPKQSLAELRAKMAALQKQQS